MHYKVTKVYWRYVGRSNWTEVIYHSPFHSHISQLSFCSPPYPKQSNLLRPEEEDSILLGLCHWPSKTGRGASIDHTPLLLRALTILFNKFANGEQPKLQLCLTLIDKLATTAEVDPSLADETNRAIRMVLKQYPHMWPGTKLLRIGVRTAELTNDVSLASDLIGRQVEKHLEKYGGAANDENDKAVDSSLPVPLLFLKRSLELCIHSTNSDCAATIFRNFESIAVDYSQDVKAEIYTLACLCQARAGECDKAKTLLLAMMEKGLEPKPDLFGAVLHSLAVNGRYDEAKELFQSMENLQEGFVGPVASCYNAMLVLYIQGRKWNEAIAVYDKMQARQVPPNPQTIQGLLLAHRQRSGKDGAVKFVQSVVEKQVPIDEATFKLASKMLVPELTNENMDEFRKGIRAIGEEKPILREASLNVIRTARIAEVEDQKKASKSLHDSSLFGGKEGTLPWMAALAALVEFSQAQNKAK